MKRRQLRASEDARDSRGLGDRLPILLVDDDPGDRTLAARALRRELDGQVRIDEAGDPDALARALETGGFELVITDYHLGWSDGLAVLQAVRTRRPDCPVIMLTGSTREGLPIEATKAGVTDFVHKSSPDAFVRLAAAVRRAIDGASPSPANHHLQRDSVPAVRPLARPGPRANAVGPGSVEDSR